MLELLSAFFLYLNYQFPELKSPFGPIWYLDNLGNFKWLSRLDRVINSGGYKIHPSKLEPIIGEVLKSAGVNTNFTVLGLPDTKWGQKVTLVLETDNLGKEKMRLITQALASVLNSYEVPKFIESINVFPRTLTGKIDNEKLFRMLSV